MGGAVRRLPVNSFKFAHSHPLTPNVPAPLSIALCNSGLISSSSDAASEQIDSLVLEIEAILGNKPTYVVSEKDGNIDWKALELLGDEKLMDEARETPAVNVAHSNSDHNSKALGMLGTVKAVDSKKVRNRLGTVVNVSRCFRPCVVLLIVLTLVF